MESETKSTNFKRLLGLALIVLGVALLLGRMAFFMFSVQRIPVPPQPPAMPEMPDMPAMPEMPAIPDVPDIPDIPAIPAVPRVPAMPRLPLLASGLAATGIMTAGIYLIARGMGRPSAPASGPEADRPPAV